MSLNSIIMYRGWAITAGCLPLAATDDQAHHFMGRSVAVLIEPKQESDWTDPRPQRITISDRIFECREACVDALVIQTRILIDALQRKSSEYERPYSVYAKMIRCG